MNTAPMRSVTLETHGVEGLPELDNLSDPLLLARFVGNRDDAAFQMLVRRHGPMVLGVCRRLLHNAHDAEDAFQATFLILVRKAATLRQPELLSSWLYGVAYRVAVKARSRAARRSEFERQVAVMSGAERSPAFEVWELRDVLDTELQRLPDKYRTPLVLCYLEGLTNEQAARKLGWPIGSMSARLARGRELLRKRLVRRGLAVAAVPFVLWLTETTATAQVPVVLAEATVGSALLYATDGAVATAAGATVGTTSATIPSSILTLVEQTLPALTAPKGSWPMAVLLALCVLLGGTGAATCSLLVSEFCGGWT